MLGNLGQFFTNWSNLLFTVFSILIIGGAVFMISYAKVVHMVVSLAFTFLSLAGLYVLLDAEFVAFVQVLIYAGAVSILMIFGIMMTRHHGQEETYRRPAHHVLLAIGVLVLFGVVVYSIQNTAFAPPDQALPQTANTESIGQLLYNQYAIPFELVSVLLTVAFIGAIILAKREGE